MPYISADYKLNNEKFNCDVCHAEIVKAQAVFKCDGCGKNYHSSCKSIYGANIKRLASQPTWFCLDECREDYETNSNQHNLQNIKQKISKQSTTVACDSQQFEQLKEFIKEVKNELIEKINIIHQSQEFICEKFDEIDNKIKLLTRENKMLKQDMSSLKSNQNKYQTIINEMESKFDIIQQDKTKNDLIIAGLPSKEIEPKIVLNAIFTQIDAVEPIDNIESATYMQTNSNHPENSSNLLLVQFKTQELKNNILLKKNQKQSLTLCELNLPFQNKELTDRQIYFREFLTPFQTQLYREIKTIQTIYKFKYTWVKNRTIYIRYSDNSKIFSIRSRNDIDKLRKTLKPLRESSSQNSSILSSY